MASTAKSLLPIFLLFLLLFLYRPRHDLRNALDNAVDQLASRILAQLSNVTKPVGLRLTSNGFCEHEWVLTKGKDRPSLSLRKECKRPTTRKPSLEICRLISGKRLLFVGPDTTFHLHALWLDSLESYEKRSHHCLGREYCTFHHICRPPASAGNEDMEELSGRKKKLPSHRTLLAHNSSLLQYALSTTLYASPNKDDTAYIYPVVDTQTGIRTSNTFWLRQARKADIIVMNRGPVAAPAFTYPVGNWNFVHDLCIRGNHLSPISCNDDLEHAIANAAMHATIDSFLPALLRTLHIMSTELDLENTLTFWHGSWFIQPLCAGKGLPKGFPLLRDIYSNTRANGFIDSWSLYYNAQVYIHDRLLPSILILYNITYIPMAIPGYPRSSYMRFTLEDSASEPLQTKDCIRDPWPKFGEDILDGVLFRELISLLHRA